MPKQNDYTLTNNELKQVRQAMKDLDARVSKRATIVYNLHLGYTPKQLSQMHDISLASVYNYFNVFKDEARVGLMDKPRSGRPQKSTPEYIKRLEETLETDPQTLGYVFTIWTQPRLRTYLAQQTGIDLSERTLQDLMHDLGYRYRRPKTDLGHKQDPELREQVKGALQELKKVPSQAILSYSLWTK